MPGFLPRSLWFFAATALIFVLQLSPFPGLYLMLFGGALWSIATINAGFVGLGLEAVAGRAHKAWLIAPLAWFLGYGYVAWDSHRAVDFLAEQVRVFNGERQVAFDPTKQSLVLERTGFDGDDTVRSLLEGYDLPVVYAVNRGPGAMTHTAWRVSRTEDCMSINDSHRFQTTIRGVPLTSYAGAFPQFVVNTCFFSTPEEPPTPVVAYSVTGSEKRRQGYLDYGLVTVTLKDVSGTTSFQSVSATPYSWFPAPVMGCALNSGNPSWDCSAGFLRASAVWAEARPVDTAAKALGLRPIASITAAAAQQRQTEHVKTSLDVFNDFLADPSKPITGANLRDVAIRADQYDKSAPEIVVAIGKVLAEPEPRLQIAANLGEMLARLSDAQFAAIVRKLLGTYAAAPQLNMDVIWDRMATRLGSLGEPALPVLERLAFERKEPWSRPIYALCRVGAPAARDGERIAEHLRGTLRSDSEHLAAFKTLLRLGRGDLLADEPDGQSQYRSDDYKYWRRTITPGSSPDVCLD